MFIVVLSTTAKKWHKQPKHPLSNAWINKMNFINQMHIMNNIQPEKGGKLANTAMWKKL